MSKKEVKTKKIQNSYYDILCLCADYLIDPSELFQALESDNLDWRTMNAKEIQEYIRYSY